jgi:hypothetical protein
MGEGGNGADVDHFQRRVRDAFEEDCFRAGPDRLRPLVEVGAVDEGDLHAVTRQHLFEDVEAGPEERPRRDHVIARPQHRGERAVHRCHAGRRCKAVFRPFEGCDPLFEHRHGGVAVAGVDEFVRPALRNRASAASAVS